MKTMRCIGLFLLLVAELVPLTAHADQRRDWPLATNHWGNNAYFDYLGGGAAMAIERREPFFGGSNAFTLAGSTLLGQYMGQGQVTASLRVLLLEVGATAGYRALWRNLAFEAGDDGEYCKACDRPARRTADPIWDSTTGLAHYGYLEGHVGLYLPLNEWMILGSQFTAHYENSPDRSYDQIYANIHDGGLMYISETTLFFKHRDWGAIGPYMQVMSMPRAGHHETEAAWGFNGLTRLGLIKRNDAVVLSLLVRPGDGTYGQHWYYWPARLIVAYHMAFEF